MVRATRHISLWLIGVGLVCASPASIAWAQASKKKSEQQAEKLNLEEVKKDLASRQESRVVGALNLVKSAPTQAKELAPDVERLLSRGSTLKIALGALSALGDLSEPSSSKAIAPYVRHRSANVRQTAAHALVRTGGPDAVIALRAALRAPDPQVRDIAARGLGNLKAKDAVGDLFQALDQRVYSAAVSLGKLCSPAACLKFMDRLGKVHLEVITSGTDEILFRPATEVDEKTKLQVIEKLAGLRTTPATEYLADVYRRWPKDGSKSLKKALRDAVEDNGGDLGEDQ